jgi:hypothetical protein
MARLPTAKVSGVPTTSCQRAGRSYPLIGAINAALESLLGIQAEGSFAERPVDELRPALADMVVDEGVGELVDALVAEASAPRIGRASSASWRATSPGAAPCTSTPLFPVGLTFWPSPASSLHLAGSPASPQRTSNAICESGPHSSVGAPAAPCSAAGQVDRTGPGGARQPMPTGSARSACCMADCCPDREGSGGGLGGGPHASKVGVEGMLVVAVQVQRQIQPRHQPLL